MFLNKKHNQLFLWNSDSCRAPLWNNCPTFKQLLPHFKIIHPFSNNNLVIKKELKIYMAANLMMDHYGLYDMHSNLF